MSKPGDGVPDQALGERLAHQDYYERRIKEGKTRREIVRCLECLKRYAAREVFHLVKQLQSAPCS